MRNLYSASEKVLDVNLNRDSTGGGQANEERITADGQLGMTAVALNCDVKPLISSIHSPSGSYHVDALIRDVCARYHTNFNLTQPNLVSCAES